MYKKNSINLAVHSLSAVILLILTLHLWPDEKCDSRTKLVSSTCFKYSRVLIMMSVIVGALSRDLGVTTLVYH